MWVWCVLVFSCIYVALSTKDDKYLFPIQWNGGITKMDDSGKSTNVFNGLSTRAQILGDSAFLCNPRLKPGIEATLLKMNMFPKEGVEDSCIEAFPSGKEQKEGDCQCLQSVVDLSLDHEGVLWVLDIGVTFSANFQPTPRCPPKIVGFNVHTKKMEKLINLAHMVGPPSRLQFLVSDYSVEGKRWLYAADAGTKALIAWDVENNKGFRAVLPEAVIKNNKPLDVLYLNLIKKETGNNLLFFSYRSGDDMFCIHTKDLQTDANTGKAWDVGKKPTKMIILGTDEWESLYFRYEDKADIYKWNATTPFNEKNFHMVHRADSTLSATHAVPDFKRGVMRMVESNLMEYIKKDSKPADALNSLTVMTIRD